MIYFEWKKIRENGRKLTLVYAQEMQIFFECILLSLATLTGMLHEENLFDRKSVERF